VLTTTVERLEGNNVKLSVTVTADEVDAAIDKAYKSVGEKIKVPGFRPGKAPRPMLDTMVGREYIMQQATEEIVESTYPRALDNEALRPIESPEMDELGLVEAGKDYEYKADVALRPEYTLTGTDGLSVSAPPREATKAEIDLQLEAARGRYATLEPVEGRGVEKEDFVLLSFVGTVDGEAYDGNTVDKYLYEMGQGLMPAEFDQGLLGAASEDEIRIEFDIPDTSSVEEYVGKKAAFDVTVHEIKSKKLPEIDDEFALNVGGFESVDEMMAQLKEAMDRQAEMAHLQAKERALREALAARLDGEAPQPMVESRAESLMRDFMVMLDTRGVPIEQYFAGTGMGMEQLEAEMQVQAKQAVLEDLALEALFREKGLEVTPEDIDRELEDISKSGDTTPEEARKRWEDLGLMNVIREQVVHRKAVGWLMDNATVTIEEPTIIDTPADAEKPAAKKKTAAKKKPTAKAKSGSAGQEGDTAPESAEE